MPAGAIRHLDHDSPHGHELHECGSSAGLDWTTKEHEMSTTAPNFTYTDRIGGTEVVEDLLAELREDLVNSLDDAMGKCPHEGVSSEWDLCNACAADTAVKVVRYLLDYERLATGGPVTNPPAIGEDGCIMPKLKRADVFDEILAVPCPACKAPAGAVCEGRDRRWSHINRRAATAR